MNLNKVQLIGSLGRDPEIRTTSSGKKVCNLRVATNKSIKQQDGSYTDQTEWHQVVIWNERLCERMEKKAQKGSQVYVEGSIQTRSWEKDGEKKYATEVVVDRFNGDADVVARGRDDSSGSSDFSANKASYGAPTVNNARGAQGPMDLDDEMPF